MAAKPLEPAEAVFSPVGTPYSARFEDVYHSSAGGLEQARHVFLAGNGLPEAWRDRDAFVILETGFGLGVNFLAAWQAWRADPRRCRRLHFVSLEKHPFRRDDLARLHAAWPELADLSSQLLAAWPVLTPGLHRLHFAGTTLTLAFGDALDLLPRLRLQADAFFLDGFSPAKNPDLWSAEVANALAKLAAPGATLATWSVAGQTKSPLAAAGFELAKRPGFGDKREMLVGRLGERLPPAAAQDRRIIVVGAGAAGSFAARALADHGFQVTVIERRTAPGEGASGNKAGVFRPQPSVDDNRLARLLRACFLYGRRRLEALAPLGARAGFTGALQLARDDKHEEAQRRAVEQQRLPPEFCRFVEQAEATQLAGWPVERGGWWFPMAGWASPPSLCAAALTGLEVRYGADVARTERQGGLWRLYDAAGALIAEAPQLVLAAGIETPKLAPAHPLPIRVGRGLVSHIPEAAVPPFHIVATRSGYVTPAVDGIHCAGATQQDGDEEPAARLGDHVENLARLNAILPGYAERIDPALLDGRVGFRPMSPDKLPIVGPLSASDGLHVVSGFGARGLVFAALCGELLACRLTGEPLPIEGDLADALHPQRFARVKTGNKV
ncbi:MAG TPA: bifunctional tRNA (5-methylaminomethyl-2-thiouridine)(34)-methyltransferase MnmD/FAD-dependent 5-carboxymethylaminomethyl-2-thiouridine(34) oxidoreductase MnmC [Rhodocyclaceae bacterium]|nr:bifunctional tRNA (5-methylaminomethyl-2-thiouridine)(34)-methyltransferase MnmD/FAD-dependent 5-carboxymethylaminomethyl-2-thiouridine(34) oxidoreductase MnmC [Rhodocyclaceae bacterium]